MKKTEFRAVIKHLHMKEIKKAKLDATVFWDARGIIHIDYLLKKKRPYLAKKKVLFHDNARIHTYPEPMVKFNEFRYELLPHPAYSPDLALYDYFLFPNLKKWFYSDGLKKLENRWIKCIKLKGDYVEK
ncbi:SETMR methyltransferase, partial [Acromyrmex insinuator]